MLARKQNRIQEGEGGGRRGGKGCKGRKEGERGGGREEGVRGGGNKRAGAGTGQCTQRNLGITV